MAEQISLFDGTQPFKIDKPIRLIELFAGIGAQAKALENLGVDFEHYRICEFDKYAVKSYNAIHGTNFETSDITKITADDLGIVDTDKYCYVMTYSFPCQDLSNAGNGKGMTKGSGTRSGLLWEVERLLTETKELAQVLVMENVPQILSKQNMPDFAQWIAFLDGLGYKSKYALLNAKDYGIPQNRERCFMVSILGDYFYEFPSKKPLKLRLKDMLEERVTERYYLSEQAVKEVLNASFKSGQLDKQGAHKPIIWDGYNQRIRADSECVGTITQNVGADLKRNGQGIIEPIIKVVVNYYPSNHDASRIVDVDGLAPTIKENHGTVTAIGEPMDKYRIRKLTPKECWRLMGFADADVDKAVAVGISASRLYKAAGNSIVVQVLEAIFKQMI